MRSFSRALTQVFVVVTFEERAHIAHGAFHTRCGLLIPDVPITAWRTYQTAYRPADCCRACFFAAHEHPALVAA